MLVGGAAISTDRRASAGDAPTMRQPPSRRKPTDGSPKALWTTVAVKRVDCMWRALIGWARAVPAPVVSDSHGQRPALRTDRRSRHPTTARAGKTF